jgi:hypothetical protein
MKWVDGKFVTLTPQERDALKAENRWEEPTPWTVFKLWDENGRETEDPNYYADADDWATFPIQPAPVQVHYRKKTVDAKRMIQREIYSLKGLGVGGEEKVLEKADNLVRVVSKEKFEKFFPEDPSAQGEAKP